MAEAGRILTTTSGEAREGSAMSYPFADRAAEDERLVAQAALFDPRG